MEGIGADGGHDPGPGRPVANSPSSLYWRLLGIAFTVLGLTLLLWGTRPGLLLNAWLDRLWLATTYHLLGGLGASVVEHQTTLFGPGFAMSIKGMCNGLFGWVLLVSAALFWPSPWPKKAVGLFLGLAVLVALNAIRLITLFVVGTHSVRAGHFIHDVLWPLIYLAIAATACYFLSRSSTRKAHTVACG